MGPASFLSRIRIGFIEAAADDWPRLRVKARNKTPSGSVVLQLTHGGHDAEIGTYRCDQDSGPGPSHRGGPLRTVRQSARCGSQAEAGPAALQSGRASCQGRVCKDGVVSGGADTLT